MKPASQEQRKYLIVCVDDEKMILDALERELRLFLPDDCSLELAESGAEAIDVVQDFMQQGYEVPLIIVDYMMPGMRGDELLQAFGLLSPASFGILLTGQADIEGVRNSIRSARLQSFILKPWDMVDLRGDVLKTLDIYEKEQQINRQNALLQQANATLEEKVAQKTGELLQKNAVLEEMNREKDNVLSIVAHDLRAPLNNIYGLLDLINNNLIEPQEKDGYMELVFQEILKGQRHIDELLAVCNYDKWQMKQVNYARLPLRGYLLTLVKQFIANASKKNIAIHLHEVAADLVLETDEDLLTRILQNLISNAIKFSYKNKHINISAYERAGIVYILVKDEGLGFSEEDKRKIFQRFQRLSAHPTGGESSTGLGLSIVKKFTELLQGTVSFESVEGFGTTFTLAFPQCRPQFAVALPA